MKSEDYGIAYSEVISILHKIPREYYEKVPII